MHCLVQTASFGGKRYVLRSWLLFKTVLGHSKTYLPANEQYPSDGFSASSETPKANSRSTNAESWSKAILKLLAWISTKPLLLSSELNQSELSSLLQPPTISTSYTSTAKMPSCMAKATSRYMSHNQKALWMNGFLQKFYISTSLSMALNRLLVSGIFSFVEW